MTKATISPKKEATVRKTAASAPQAETQTNESSAPLWKANHGRVQGAIWKYLQDDGKTRFTISISRSYKDKESEEWKNVHYFDRRDLDDVRSICLAADEAIQSEEGMTAVVGED